MSLLGLMSSKEQDAGPGGIEAPSTDIADVISASAESTARNYNLFSKELFTGVEQNDNNKKYQALTGRNIYKDSYDADPDRDALYKSIGHDDTSLVDKRNAAVDRQILKLKSEDPEKYKDLKTSTEISDTVKQKAKDSAINQGKVSAGATGLSSFFGQIGGGLGAGLIDPINLATIPLGSGLATGIFKRALIDAGINVGAEVANYPFVQKWQHELGEEYGPSTLAENAGIGALFGFAAGLGGGVLEHSIAKMDVPNSVKLSEIRERLPENPEAQSALRHEERRLHIDETNPTKYSEEVPPSAHQRGVEEIDAAINEERPINASAIGISDEEIRGLNPEKMDDSLAEAHAAIIEEPSAPKEVRAEPNEIFENPPVQDVTHEEHKAQMELHDSPEAVAQEYADFEAATKDLDPNTKIFLDGEGEHTTIEELRNSFKNDNEYLAAISSCGLGGGE